MIILDTNVVSEILKETPDPSVFAWVHGKNFSEFALSVISLAEIKYGFKKLPAGKRKAILENKFNKFLKRGFKNTILSFTEVEAEIYASLSAKRRALGLSVQELDMMIGATTLANNAMLATRNTKDFTSCEITLINPWQP